MRLVGLLLLLAAFSFGLRAQQIRGRVVNSLTGEPMPFVNIRFDRSKQGLSTDINGRFDFVKPARVNSLTFSFVGFYDTILTPGNKPQKYYIVKMRARLTELQEVSIFPGKNPAHRIMALAIENRKRNRPENLKAFYYVSYNKMLFTADPDGMDSDSLKADSLAAKLHDFFEKQHLFLMESLTRRYYRKPDKSYEEVLASRVSGLSLPSFVLMANEFQSLSFYDAHFRLMGVDFINPLAKGSLQKYLFLLEDTLYNQKDTVFIIRFRPYKGKQFNGLSGILYINSNGWAVQNVIARPAPSADLKQEVKIQQLYRRFDSVWFPVQLNTTIKLKSIEINHAPIVGLGTSYLDSIKINPQFSKKVFRSGANIDVPDKAFRQEESLWKAYRHDSLSPRDKETYRVIDSVGRSVHLDRKMLAMQSMAAGKIALGPVSLPLSSLLAYNSYEKLRLGLGLQTNQRLSRKIYVGAWAAYAFGDKTWKYGGRLLLSPKPNSDLKILLRYSNDLEESASQEYFSPRKSFSSTGFRSLLVSRMNLNEEWEVRTDFRALKYFVWHFGAAFNRKASTGAYAFLSAQNANGSMGLSQFDFAELRFGFRFNYMEKLWRYPNKKWSIKSHRALVFFDYIRGIHGYGADFDYHKINFKITRKFYLGYYGISSVQIRAGWVNRPLPYFQLYNGAGSYLRFYVYTPATFTTMRLNEFLSDHYMALFWSHNFGKVFGSSPYFSPSLLWVNNMAWGSLSEPEMQMNIRFNTMEKGYFESGILLNNILSSALSKVGFGVFYRYGPYAFSAPKNNWAYVLTLSYAWEN